MPAPYLSPVPQSTPYEYVGEPPALGGVALTKLARTYAELDTSDLSDLFPDQYSPERTIIIETIMEGIGIMPMVRPGIPSGNFLPNDKIFRRTVEPALFREDDFVDQYLLNQLRQVGTQNDVINPQAMLQDRVRRLVARHNRTIDFFRIQVLLGSINYEDPRTGVKIDVTTQIPLHNLYRYDGYDSSVAKDATITVGTTAYKAAKALTNNKGRKEAVFFGSADERLGVPWTDPDADIVRCLRLIKEKLRKTNKNVYTDLYVSSDLYTIILENNYIKASDSRIGFFNYGTDQGGVADSKRILPVTNSSNNSISIGPGGEINSIAGLRLHVIDQLYSDPVSQTVKNMMPAHQAVIVAKSHVNDSSQTLGYTQYCVGESPDGNPGLWMRTGPDMQPPHTPGRAMQIGNSFLPYAMYPQWICVLDVCEPNDISSSYMLSDDIDYGTF
jgi:hypothetical protein